LKPENLFVLKQKAGVSDYVKIIDFGISKFSQLNNEGMKMTKTGSVMGTPYYMSPEQANGSREADARSDLYAMGVILFECVTGAVPFDGKTFNELLFKIVLSDPPQPRHLAPNLDPAFEAIILKAMARDVTQRFQTCAEFIQALQDYQAGKGMPVIDGTVVIAAGAAPAAPAAGQPSPRIGLSTNANWSNTGTQIPKSNAPIVAALLGVGLLVLGGGALAAFKLMHKDTALSTASAVSSAPPKGAAFAAVSAVPPPAETAAPAPSIAPEPVVTASDSAVVLKTARPPLPAAPKPAPARPAHAPPRPAVPAAVAAPAPAPAPAPVPAPAPKKKPSSGATDFGY